MFGIGNPLLDIQAEAPAEFLAKYGLKPADCVLAEEKHLPIYKDLVENYDVKYIAGGRMVLLYDRQLRSHLRSGACQNSIRGCQWVLESPNATTYVGAVGADDNAKTLQECARKEGVNTQVVNCDLHAGTALSAEFFSAVLHRRGWHSYRRLRRHYYG